MLLLANAPRSTKDIDFFWLDEDGLQRAYAPPREYILSLKIAAGRDKDLADCAILLSKTRIRTREQAMQVVERYLLPSGQEKYAESIEHALRWLFEGKRG